MKVPEEGVTTYNVGVISGGTSVNTIAQQASMLYEYRSDSKNSLQKMQQFFERVVEAYRSMGVTVNVQVVGERPCASELDAAAQKSLTDKAIEIQSYYTGGKQIPTGASSTDCNSSLSCGIPSVCFGTCLGKGAHTREEYVILDSLRTGLRVAASWTLSFFTR